MPLGFLRTWTNSTQASGVYAMGTSDAACMPPRMAATAIGRAVPTGCRSMPRPPRRPTWPPSKCPVSGEDPGRGLLEFGDLLLGAADFGRIDVADGCDFGVAFLHEPIQHVNEALASVAQSEDGNAHPRDGGDGEVKGTAGEAGGFDFGGEDFIQRSRISGRVNELSTPPSPSKPPPEENRVCACSEDRKSGALRFQFIDPGFAGRQDEFGQRSASPLRLTKSMSDVSIQRMRDPARIGNAVGSGRRFCRGIPGACPVHRTGRAF